jgi:Fe-S cluster biosynthesis and repair protein YggX
MSEMTNAERLPVFKNMAEADPTNELAHFSLGKIYFEMKDLREAERSFRRVLELSPKHSQAHRYLGETLLRLEKKEEGVKLLREGVLLAHEKGEFQPRNQMQDLLRKAGVEPPMPQDGPQDGPREGKGARTASPRGQGEETFLCRRCGKPNPRLEEPPFPTALGKEIHDAICQACWREWFAMSIKVINEYRLNLMTPQGNAIYDQHMKEFLGLAE